MKCCVQSNPVMVGKVSLPVGLEPESLDQEVISKPTKLPGSCEKHNGLCVTVLIYH